MFMRKTERLFRIIERLRGHQKAVTAKTLASELEVTTRTIYRDIKALQEQAIPVEGEAGVGYMLGAGFDLPPLAFDNDELDALIIGLRLVGREGDIALKGAALSALEKIRHASGKNCDNNDAALFAPDFSQYDHLPMMGVMRLAIRNAIIVDIEYEALSGELTSRRVKPLALAFFTNAHLLGAWCELRKDFRNFRLDRIIKATETEISFIKEKSKLLRQYQAQVQCEDKN